MTSNDVRAADVVARRKDLYSKPQSCLKIADLWPEILVEEQWTRQFIRCISGDPSNASRPSGMTHYRRYRNGTKSQLDCASRHESQQSINISPYLEALNLRRQQ